MKITHVASIPLVLHDPYFSIWSSGDHLYDADTVHWCGQRQRLQGYVTIDQDIYCFLGDRGTHAVIEQTMIDVTPTRTKYYFENEKISLQVCFTSPLLLDDLTLVSRPCTYIDFIVEKKRDCDVSVEFSASEDLISRKKDRLIGISLRRTAKNGQPDYTYAMMGRAAQQPLSHSGDNITLDWGYLYLAHKGNLTDVYYDPDSRIIGCRIHFADFNQDSVILACDDLLSINYFGEWRKAYWTNVYRDVLDAIGSAFADQETVYGRAAVMDSELMQKAVAAGGEEYAFLCVMSYRQTIAAHKLISDEEGNVIFLSKENDSNGCIGTVDVSYPSTPLFLLYQTEYVKGMLRPIFRFASCDAWEYDFAPHDIGRYPYAWGQVYGLNRELRKYAFSGEQGDVFPPFYQYPAGSSLYDFNRQMPVEECGNMLLMTAAVCFIDRSILFAKPYLPLLKNWAEYLMHYGADPGEQLCTDDFAGHLSHNTNLSVKAILGVEAYARLTEMDGNNEEAAFYHKMAREMAQNWESRAFAADHYSLVFDDPDTWSLKYNMVWDKLFGSNLFSEEVYDKELAYYAEKSNRYGVPLDSRKSYTKSDWICWCAAMAQEPERSRKLLAPVAEYLKNTTSRVPFSDWYDTVSGQYCHFKARSVQGGVFMPLLMDKIKKAR